jgi:hypothetical protein
MTSGRFPIKAVLALVRTQAPVKCTEYRSWRVRLIVKFCVISENMTSELTVRVLHHNNIFRAEGPAMTQVSGAKVYYLELHVLRIPGFCDVTLCHKPHVTSQQCHESHVTFQNSHEPHVTYEHCVTNHTSYSNNVS